jgi:hypothetical protein
MTKRKANLLYYVICAHDARVQLRMAVEEIEFRRGFRTIPATSKGFDFS